MTDVVLVVVTIAFFVVCWWYVLGCDALMRTHGETGSH